MTITESPTAKSATSTAGRRAAPEAVAAGSTIVGASHPSTSSNDSGSGWWALPTKPVTEGVLRTADHDSSVSSMRTST